MTLCRRRRNVSSVIRADHTILCTTPSVTVSRMSSPASAQTTRSAGGSLRMVRSSMVLFCCKKTNKPHALWCFIKTIYTMGQYMKMCRIKWWSDLVYLWRNLPAATGIAWAINHYKPSCLAGSHTEHTRDVLLEQWCSKQPINTIRNATEVFICTDI